MVAISTLVDIYSDCTADIITTQKYNININITPTLPIFTIKIQKIVDITYILYVE